MQPHVLPAKNHEFFDACMIQMRKNSRCPMRTCSKCQRLARHMNSFRRHQENKREVNSFCLSTSPVGLHAEVAARQPRERLIFLDLEEEIKFPSGPNYLHEHYVVSFSSLIEDGIGAISRRFFITQQQ